MEATLFIYSSGPVVRKVDSAIHWIVIFQLPQEGIKSNDTRDIELTRDESDFNSKMVNFNMVLTSY